MTKEKDYEAEIERRFDRSTEELIKITVGPVCRNCRHVIAFQGLVHCRELDCDCLEPEDTK